MRHGKVVQYSDAICVLICGETSNENCCKSGHIDPCAFHGMPEHSKDRRTVQGFERYEKCGTRGDLGVLGRYRNGRRQIET